jgi:hypothetical protein
MRDTSLLASAALLAGELSAILAFLGLTSRLRPVKWLWKQLVIDPIGEWLRHQIKSSETGHLVAYHLGPNSDRRAVHERLERVERLVLLQPIAQPTLDDLEED